MSIRWNDIRNGLPPLGVPLIVTVASSDFDDYSEEGPIICFPVIYRKSFIRDEYGFYEYGMEDGKIGPEHFRVTAWMPLPLPYSGKQLIAYPFHPDAVTNWVSVYVGLPERGAETWVYALPPDGVDSRPEVDTDIYEGNRGELVKHTGPDGDGEHIASGWYAYSGWKVTHWMPIAKPEPPRTESKRGSEHDA